MKNKFFTIIASLVLVWGISVQANAQTARVQVIHNAADAAADSVDVWLNNTLLLDNFAFRTASPFINAPAGVDFDVVIQPKNSVDTTNALARFTYNLMAGETYVLVANGIVVPTGYNPATPFDIYVSGIGQEQSGMAGNTDVMVFHGATDAPVVDVFEVGAGAGNIIDNLAYGAFQGYLPLPTADYKLQIREQTGKTAVVEYDAPLATLGLTNQALVVVASGFLNPAANNNGPAFGLYVALPTGGNLIPLPSTNISTARVQVIHNAADLAADTVDVWLNNQLLIDNFAFRTATPFIDAPANDNIDIVIQPKNSVDTTNALARYTYNLTGGEKYLIVANGIVSPSGYSPAIPFNLHVYPMAQEEASMSNKVDVLVFHGSTDAPTVDVVEVAAGAGTLIDDFMYSDFAGYLSLPVEDYSLQIRNQAGNTTVAQFAAPLLTLGLADQSLVVLASGFLNPANNSNGDAFGLYVALPTGGDLIALPGETISTARVQVLHNAADLAADTVDVWLNNSLLIDNFAFRTATPFVDAPANENIDIVIQPKNSMDTNNALARFSYNLMGGEKYVLVANGIVVPTGYNPVKPFDIHVFSGAREEASMTSNTDVLVFHGATDAPIVDVVETMAPAGTIVDDLMYGMFSNAYLELPTADYSLDIRDMSGTSTVASYMAPLSSLMLDGQVISVVASGFLDPMSNNNGAPFGLYAVLSTGGDFIPLPIVTGVEEENISNDEFSLYPNPARDFVNLSFTINESSNVQYSLYNITGAQLDGKDLGYLDAGQQNLTLNLSQLPTGLYILTVQAGDSRISRKVHVLN